MRPLGSRGTIGATAAGSFGPPRRAFGGGIRSLFSIADLSWTGAAPSCTDAIVWAELVSVAASPIDVCCAVSDGSLAHAGAEASAKNSAIRLRRAAIEQPHK